MKLRLRLIVRFAPEAAGRPNINVAVGHNSDVSPCRPMSVVGGRAVSMAIAFHRTQETPALEDPDAGAILEYAGGVHAFCGRGDAEESGF